MIVFYCCIKYNYTCLLIDTDAMKDNLSTMLHTLWFQPVHKSKTTAFELIFVGEKRESQVFGLNNWMQYYFQEKEKRIDYHGYIHKNQVIIRSFVMHYV